MSSRGDDRIDREQAAPKKWGGVGRAVAGIVVAVLVCGGVVALLEWARVRAERVKADEMARWRTVVGGEMYFPTTVGAARVMQVIPRQGLTTEYTETVVGVEASGEGWVVTVETTRCDGSSSSMRYRVSPDGLFTLAFDEVELLTPYPWLKLPARVGDSWTAEATRTKTRGVTFGQQSFAVGNEEEVEVPAGRFRAIPITTAEGLPGEQASRYTIWYAAAVGPVKFVSSGGGFEQTGVLKSFTPGK